MPEPISAARLVLFGPPIATRSGRDVAIPVRKTLALLVYLCLEGPTARARLAELLWSGLDEVRARRNLRRDLHRLRGTDLGDLIVADDDRIGLVNTSSDWHAFEAAVDADRLAEARALRTGPLLDGLHLGDAEGFDEWRRLHIERFAQRWRGAMTRHAAHLEAAGDARGALAVHSELLAEDALQEATWRELMRLHDGLGERAAALDAYASCERLLREELGLEPLPETRLLARRIRARDVAGLPGAAAAAGADMRTVAAIELREVPLVARERELAAFAGFAAPLVLIEGDAGVGKSRLAEEAVRRSAGAALHAPLVVRFAEMSSSTPFYAVADALRSAAARERLAALEPVWRCDLARLLPELDAASDARGEAASPDEARARLLEALAQALSRAAGPSGWLVFDDLQWADASSLELLAHLARRRRQSPEAIVRVVATARSSELAGHAVALAALAAIESGAPGGIDRLRVEVFDEWSMLQLVQRLSGGEGGMLFAGRLVRATGGNVFFALETLRALFEAGELRADAAAGWSTRYDATTTDYAELPLPASVIEAVLARIDRLGAPARRVLETAALAEDGSSLAEMQGATALTEWETLEGIERAVAANVVERAGAGYRFLHELFRSALRSALSPERQKLTHARLAASLEPLGVASARIAAHWQQAGRDEAAAVAWIRAAEAATAVYSHREAIEHYGRAATLTGDPARAWSLHDLRIERMLMTNLFEGRSELMAHMLELAGRSGSSGLQFRALARAAHVAAEARQMEACEQHALRALREFTPPEPRWHLQALNAAAFAAGYLGRPEDSLERYREAVDVANEHNPLSEGMMGAAASMVAVRMNRLDEAEALAEAALAVTAAMPGTIQRAQVLAKTSFLARALGDRATALSRLEEAAAIGRTLRLRSNLSLYAANLCETLVDDGQAAAARVAQRECADCFADIDIPLARYLVSLTAAAVHAQHGELGDAVAAAEAAIGAADAIANLPDQREARLLCAGLLCVIGAVDEAARLADTAAAMVAPGWSRTFVAVETLRAAAAVGRGAAAARDKLVAAIAAPYDDRMLHPALEAAQVLLGRCELALGRPEAAREAVRAVRHGVGLEAEALAVRLAADCLGGPVDAETLERALALLAGERLPPQHALTLMSAVASATSAGAKRRAPPAPWRDRQHRLAMTLADSLRRRPALQAHFIRKHRDLLT